MQALIATQRAFVRLDSFICRVATKDGHRVGFTIALDWKNTGNTPAMNAITGGGIHKIRTGESEDFDLSHFSEGQAKITGRGSFGPGGGVSTKPFLVTMADIQEMAAGQLKVFIFGRVEYRDIFEGTPTHHTADCALLEVYCDPFTSNEPFLFHLHPRKYNTAD